MPEPLTATIEEHATLPAAEAIAAAAEAVEPMRDVPLPGFEPPPFDFAAALHSIVSRNRAAAAAKDEWKASAEETARLKKVYDREVDTLSALIRDCADRERGVTPRLVQGALTPQGVAASSCRYEQETGEPCPGCILLRKGGSPLPDPEDTAHAELVREALAQAEDRTTLFDDINFQFERLTPGDVEAWTPEQARDVALYVALKAELPSDVNMPALPDVLAPLTNGHATDEQVMAEAKVCLCQTPKGKKHCKTCGGTVTGKGGK